MAEVYTTGVWRPKEGHEQEFMDAWVEFASWARSMPGAGALRLSRDLGDVGRFVSFGRWDSLEQVHTWKQDGEFPARMGRVQQHVADFKPSELEVVRVAREPA